MYKFRPWEMSDLDALWSWIKDDPDVVNRWNLGDVNSWEDLFTVLVRLLQLEQAGLAMLRGIEQDDKTIGFVGAFPILPNHAAYVHVILSPDKRGHGREVLVMAIAEAKALGLGPLSASFRSHEVALVKLAESLGFVEEWRYLTLRD